MFASPAIRRAAMCLAAASIVSLAGCGHVPSAGGGNDRQCLARAMYFESVRSSDEGMLAVGTVVMNRLESGEYPKTVCGVVGQKNQFAPGVLSKSMQEGKSRERAERVASAVLSGKRHRGVGKAMFFHTAGRTYRYENMHYVLVAGGNAFYERKPVPGRRYISRTVIAQAGPRDSVGTSRWTEGNQIASVGHMPRRVTADAPPVVVAIAPAPAPQSPESIEALILASNGW